MTQSVPSADHITARLFTDPSCPWGYSANPALRVLEWRYREQIEWQLVMIGLSDPDEGPTELTPQKIAGFWFTPRERYGMPFSLEPKVRFAYSARACRAIISARLNSPGSEWKVLRALQLLNFNTPLLLDDDDQLRAAISTVAGLDADAIVAAIDTPLVEAAYRADHSEARSSKGGPGDLQGKTRSTESGSRFSPPSLILGRHGQRLEAAGFQSVDSYDVLIANLHPGLRRTPPPESPWDAVHLYPSGLTTQEVAAIMAGGNNPPDRLAAERQLIELVGEGRIRRVEMGNDAIWLAT